MQKQFDNNGIAPINFNQDGVSMWHKDPNTGQQYNRAASDSNWNRYWDSVKGSRGY